MPLFRVSPGKYLDSEAVVDAVYHPAPTIIGESIPSQLFLVLNNSDRLVELWGDEANSAWLAYLEASTAARSFRGELEKAHCRNGETELALVGTFLEMSRMEFELGETEAGQRNIIYARIAVANARKDIQNINNPKNRSDLEARVVRLEVDNPQLL